MKCWTTVALSANGPFHLSQITASEQAVNDVGSVGRRLTCTSGNPPEANRLPVTVAIVGDRASGGESRVSGPDYGT